MGIFSYFSSPDQKRAEEVRSGARAPDRTERKRCWEARDLYFSCLDRNDILDAIKDEKRAASACKAESAVFERDCAREWVGLIYILFSFYLFIFFLPVFLFINSSPSII